MSVSYENSLIQLRFIGASLETRSVPIYDLAETLTAFQRAIHFSHATLRNDVNAGYMFPDSMRSSLALQLSERKKASDGYGLIPIASGENLQAVRDASAFCLTVLNCYSRELSLDTIRNLKTTLPSGAVASGNQLLIGVAACFNQFRKVGQRLGGIGGISSAEAKSGDPEIKAEGLFTDSTKDYLNKLSKMETLGDPVRICGRVEALFPPNQILKIKTSKGQGMLIYCDDIGMDKVQKDTRKNVYVECYGDPRFKFGVESKFFDRIHAHRVTVLEDVNNLEELIKYTSALEKEEMERKAFLNDFKLDD